MPKILKRNSVKTPSQLFLYMSFIGLFSQVIHAMEKVHSSPAKLSNLAAVKYAALLVKKYDDVWSNSNKAVEGEQRRAAFT